MPQRAFGPMNLKWHCSLGRGQARGVACSPTAPVFAILVACMICVPVFAILVTLYAKQYVVQIFESAGMLSLPAYS